MSEYVEFLERIVSRLIDYRHGEIPPFHVSHVARWIGQFVLEDRLTILAETDRMLEQRYVSRDEMTRSIRQLLKHSLAGLPSEQIEHVQLLQITRKGKGGSQGSLAEIMRQVGLEEYGCDFIQPRQTPHTFLYIDDCLFTGNTVLNDLRAWLTTLESTSSIKRLCLLFHTIHSGGQYYVNSKIETDPSLGKIKDKTQIQFVRTISNSRSSRDDTLFKDQPYDCFWSEQPQNPSIELQRLIAKLPPEARLYRPAIRMTRSVLFSTPQSRTIVERNFLEKGAFIMAQPSTVQSSMRPLGFEKLGSLGFGAMYVTYRNISNNCPLVLWWGDPNAPTNHPFRTWYPLIPRLANEGQQS